MSLTLAKSKFERRFCLDLLTGSQGVKVNLLDKHSRLFAIFSKVALFIAFFSLAKKTAVQPSKSSFNNSCKDDAIFSTSNYSCHS